MSEPATERPDGSDTVVLIVPADPAYVSVLRTVTASLAARRDFTLDEIDDLRIAVDEASALLLPHALSGAELAARFSLTAGSLQIEVALTRADIGIEAGSAGALLDRDSFAWMVLSALADTVQTGSAEGRLSLTISKARSARSR